MVEELKQLMRERLYRHYRVSRMTGKAGRMLERLFETYMGEPRQMPGHVLHRIEDGINAVRVFIPKCWFDAVKCARGLDALQLYRCEYDEKLRVLQAGPLHDWTSHAADAFRYLAMGMERRPVNAFHRQLDYKQHGIA